LLCCVTGKVHPRKAHEQLYYFCNLGVRWELGGQPHASDALSRERDPVSIV